MSRKTWIVKGKLKVNGLPNSVSANNFAKPLAGVKVKIYAHEGVKWNLWGTTTSNSDGSFFLSKKKDRTKRKFKIEVQFKNNDLVIYGDNESLMATVLKHFGPIKVISGNTSGAIESILDHVSRLTFKPNWYRAYEGSIRSNYNGTRTFDRTITITSSTDNRFIDGLANKHAIMWYVSHRMIKHLKFHQVPFAKKIAIKYPHNNALISDKVETAYASPINYCAYLVKNKLKDNLANNRIDILMHELMHLWAYRYSRGEGGMAWQLLIHQSTHDGLQAKEFVAFHEAFAEFSSRVLVQNIFKQDTYNTRPYSKVFLKDRVGIPSLSKMDNHETGWTQVFNCLMNGRLDQYDFISDGPFATIVDPRRISHPTPKLTVYEIMELFYSPKQLKTSEMTLDTILSRIQLLDDEFDDAVILNLRNIFNVEINANYPKPKPKLRVVQR